MGGSTMITVRLPDELAEWATAYAEKREVSRTELIEQAVMAYREDCASGVPEFRERLARARAASSKLAPTREDFNIATAARSELFRSLETPLSAKIGQDAALKQLARENGSGS